MCTTEWELQTIIRKNLLPDVIHGSHFKIMTFFAHVDRINKIIIYHIQEFFLSPYLNSNDSINKTHIFWISLYKRSVLVVIFRRNLAKAINCKHWIDFRQNFLISIWSHFLEHLWQNYLIAIHMRRKKNKNKNSSSVAKL